MYVIVSFFFFQAEDGIRDKLVTGVQTCALPLAPDAHEDDNSCNAADVRGTVTLPFRDTLAIENPHDIDWIRFHVGGVVATTVQFRLRALPGVHPDSLKDLDFYVLKAPNPGDTALQLVLADTATGSDVDRT